MKEAYTQNPQRYQAYRPSGTKWIGNIPTHWKTTTIKRVSPTGSGGTPPIERQEYYGGGIPWVTSSELREQTITGTGKTISERATSEITSLKLHSEGSVVIAMYGATIGRLGILGMAATVNQACCVCDGSEPLDTKFLFHWLLANKDSLSAMGQGGGQPNLSQEIIKGFPICLPPPEEQTAIVQFLDHADEQIQRYIAAKERLIALLEEQRQALVHQAVTRGLDPSVRLKDSRIEWLGDVPEHWSIRTLGQIADSFRTGPFGSMLHQSDYTEGGTPVINPIHIRSGVIVEDPSCSVSEAVADRLSAYRLAQHDLIFSRRGELGRCALVRDRETNWLCGTGSIRVHIEYASIEPEFLIQALQVQWVGEYLSLASVGATMNNLNTGILKSVPILVPPVREQRYILEHVGRQSRAIHHAISQAHHQINLINEYRTRLIADVVTGQLDVRDAAAQIQETPLKNKLSDEIVATQEVSGR